MNQLPFLLVPACFLLVTGCSDPADQVHKSTAAEPSRPDASAAVAASATKTTSGTDYVVRTGSTIGFTGSKVTGSHNGGFTNFSGTFTVADGKLVGTPRIQIGLESIWSDNRRLTGHLLSPDFFDGAKYPVATFTATAITPEGARQKITGNLDLHGVTKAISFPADVTVTEDMVGVKASFAINRKDFNINYPGKPNDLIRDHVVIRLDLKATPGPARPQDLIPN